MAGVSASMWWFRNSPIKNNWKKDYVKLTGGKTSFSPCSGMSGATPLGVISDAFELLPALDTPEAQEIRAIIKRQITRMTHLTNDLLDVSRISAGQIEIGKQSCDFAAIVREAAEDYRGILGSVGIYLELRLPNDPVWVLADCRRLAQSVGNLLHNMNKFTPPGGMVTVILAIVPNQQTAVLKVRDTGIGMDESTPDPFVRAIQPGVANFRSEPRRTRLGSDFS